MSAVWSCNVGVPYCLCPLQICHLLSSIGSLLRILKSIKGHEHMWGRTKLCESTKGISWGTYWLHQKNLLVISSFLSTEFSLKSSEGLRFVLCLEYLYWPSPKIQWKGLILCSIRIGSLLVFAPYQVSSKPEELENGSNLAITEGLRREGIMDNSEEQYRIPILISLPTILVWVAYPENAG